MSNELPPINIKQAVPFFMVKNMEASLAFYTGKLGFTIAIDWQPRGKIEWCWLMRDAIAIMLQEPLAPSFRMANAFCLCFYR